ncbi:MAG: hypothetical protein ACJ72E_09405 [Marmoricola sp.]
MRSVRADLPRALVCLLLLGLIGLAGCSGNTSIPPPRASGDGADARSAAATRTVERLESALRAHDGTAASALGLGAEKTLLGDAAANVDRLGLADLSLRFVDDRSAVAPNDSSATGAWKGTVEVAYRISGWDSATTTDETTFVFAPGAGGQLVTSIGDDDGRTPLWLTGTVTPLAAGRTLVLTRTGDGARYSRLAQRAVRDVGLVLPRWHGRLVIEVPASQDELDHALGADQQQYADIAAVTASVDGSLVPTAPVHVFLNPQVFDALGPRGAQVVISHESTHVATRATFATMPTWLLEGFADYVALDHAGIPVAVAASQILAGIRRHGPPDHLPTADELAPTAAGLGATYEEAWLATRYVAVLYGEAKLVAFYFVVSGGENLDTAFGRVLGTTQAAFVKSWSADARRLARTLPAAGHVAG